MSARIYLDYNATTPLASEVIAAMQPYLREGYGNPSSLHWAGVPARDAVETARSQVAGLLCSDPTEITFTSGGTEANNLAIKGTFFAKAAEKERPHFITTQIEHPAVLEPLQFIERLGARVTRLSVDRFGLVDPDDVRRAIGTDTVLISVMHANNEVGSIQPIEEIARIAGEYEVLCHTDAAQTVGKIPADVESLGVDLLSVAGHKLYGPKGVGALFIREGVRLEPLLHGAAHEAGKRAGTENVLEIVGLGAACLVSHRWIKDTSIVELTNRLWSKLQSAFQDDVVLNGHPKQRLPNTLNVSFYERDGAELLGRIPHVAASTGSACHAGSVYMSPVLEAMGLSPEVGLGAIRFSLGRFTTTEEIDFVAHNLATCIPARVNH
jgi:cysteine desulfurase